MTLSWTLFDGRSTNPIRKNNRQLRRVTRFVTLLYGQHLQLHPNAIKWSEGNGIVMCRWGSWRYDSLQRSPHLKWVWGLCFNWVSYPYDSRARLLVDKDSNFHNVHNLESVNCIRQSDATCTWRWRPKSWIWLLNEVRLFTSAVRAIVRMIKRAVQTRFNYYYDHAKNNEG